MGRTIRLGFRFGFGVLLALTIAGCATQNGEPLKPQRVNLTSLPAGASAAATGETPLTAAVLAAVNAYRAEKGVAPLAADPALQHAAAVHSADMALRNFIGNFNPDGQGAQERVLAVKPDYKGSVMETISVRRDAGSPSPDALAADIVKGWTVDPTQRKVLRDASFTQTGIGTATKGNDVYVTEVFATP